MVSVLYDGGRPEEPRTITDLVEWFDATLEFDDYERCLKILNAVTQHGSTEWAGVVTTRLVDETTFATALAQALRDDTVVRLRAAALAKTLNDGGVMARPVWTLMQQQDAMEGRLGVPPHRGRRLMALTTTQRLINGERNERALGILADYETRHGADGGRPGDERTTLRLVIGDLLHLAAGLNRDDGLPVIGDAIALQAGELDPRYGDVTILGGSKHGPGWENVLADLTRNHLGQPARTENR